MCTPALKTPVVPWCITAKGADKGQRVGTQLFDDGVTANVLDVATVGADGKGQLTHTVSTRIRDSRAGRS